jgi:hypothetical protein
MYGSPHLVHWNATDASGGAVSCSMRVFVHDAEQPSIVACPGVFAAPLHTDAGLATRHMYLVTAFADNSQVASTIVNDYSTGSTNGAAVVNASFPIGSHRIIFTARDAANNARRCIVAFVVQDTTVPQLVLSASYPATMALQVDPNLYVMRIVFDEDVFFVPGLAANATIATLQRDADAVVPGGGAARRVPYSNASIDVHGSGSTALTGNTLVLVLPFHSLITDAAFTVVVSSHVLRDIANLSFVHNVTVQPYVFDTLLVDNCAAPSPCQNNGTCFDGINSFTCACAAGFTDQLCSSCDPLHYGTSCLPCPACSVHGLCDDTMTGSGLCVCDLHWDLALCDDCVFEHYGATCAACLCVNGVCNDGVSGDGLCASCSTGWQGATCSVCDTGFFGPTCTACPACVNGACNEGIGNDGTCICNAGWDGALCDVCAPLSFGATCAGTCLDCGTYGTCDDGLLGSGVCVCQARWLGAQCDAFDGLVSFNFDVHLNEDSLINITLRASNPNNSMLLGRIDRLPSYGTLYQTPDGFARGAAILVNETLLTDAGLRLVYEPFPNVWGRDDTVALDSFDFRNLQDSFEGFVPNVGTVSLFVHGVNDAPETRSFAVQLNEDFAAEVLLRGAHSGFDLEDDALNAMIVALPDPAYGTLFQVVTTTNPLSAAPLSKGAAILSVPAWVTHASQTVLFVPRRNVFGTDVTQLEFLTSDGQYNSSARGVVTLSIAPFNDAPLAVDAAVFGFVSDDVLVELAASDPHGKAMSSLDFVI